MKNVQNNETEAKVEVWNGHSIQFVKLDDGWWAVGYDVANALGYTNARKALGDHVEARDKNTVTIRDGKRGNPKTTVISEFGIYDLVFSSKQPSAKQFKRWVYDVIKQLRQTSDLEIFDMFDKKNQKVAMSNLKLGLLKPTKLDYIKANTMVDKVVSNNFGFQKMVKKDEMTAEMLAMRARMLPQVVNFIVAYRQLGITTGIAQALYLALDQSAKKVA